MRLVDSVSRTLADTKNTDFKFSYATGMSTLNNQWQQKNVLAKFCPNSTNVKSLAGRQNSVETLPVLRF